MQDKSNAIWQAALNVANAADGRKILYDINPIKKVGRAVKSAAIPINTNVSQTSPAAKSKNKLAPKKSSTISEMEQSLNELNDSGLLQQFAREHTTVLQRIADSIRDTIRRVNRAVSMEDLQLTDSEKRRFSDLANELAGMEKTMRNALRTVEKQGANKNTATEGGGTLTGNVKYSRKLSFAEQVDATLNNELDRNTSVYVMETPEMLQSLGLKEYPMLMTQRHIMDINHAKSNKNDHWHGIPDSTIKQLPNAIENPLVIMRSAKQNGDIVLVTSLFDTDGLPVLVSIHPDGKGQYNRTEIASNFITSMYGKKGFGNFIQSAVGDKRVLYNNAKRTRNLFSKVGLQLPKLLNQDGFFNINVSQTSPTVKSKNKLAPKKSSTISEMEQSLNALNDEYRSLEKQDAEFQTAPEYTALMDVISDGRAQKRSLLDKPEALKQALDAYSTWQEESGYSDVIHRMEELRGEMKTLRGQLDSAKEQAAKEAKAATRAGYSESMAKDYATKAARKFGTTSNFGLAGYLTTNGTLLDFSDGQGYRVRDHREITDVLDFLPEDHGYSDGMIEFMNLGNIRLQSQGIDISKAPNSAQRSMLRKFFQSKNGDVVVDFSDVDGRSVGSLEYNRGTRADRILNDIDTYFETGVIPEQSVVSQFHSKFKLAAPTKDSNGKTLTEAQAEYFKDSKVRDENGNLRVVYHGTGADFTVFDKSKVGQNYSNRGGDLGFYFSPYIEDAQGYARENGGKRVEAVYLNLKNPLVVEDTGWGSAIGQADARHGDLMRWAKDGNHDGIIVKSLDEDMGNGEVDTVYIAFEPEQIKRVSNQNPTSDPDIRYSRSNKAALDGLYTYLAPHWLIRSPKAGSPYTREVLARCAWKPAADGSLTMAAPLKKRAGLPHRQPLFRLISSFSSSGPVPQHGWRRFWPSSSDTPRTGGPDAPAAAPARRAAARR